MFSLVIKLAIAESITFLNCLHEEAKSADELQLKSFFNVLIKSGLFGFPHP